MRTPRQTDATAAKRRAASYTTLGTIATTAPRIALLRALRRLRPDWTVRLQNCAPRGDNPVYRIELRDGPDERQAHSIDPWLRIKSALMAEFPADKPHAVMPIDT